MYIKRQIEEEILRISQYYSVLMICGARQVGKSTMLNHICDEKRKFVSLDDINARRLAENEPSLFFETYGKNLIIDEFQRVPSLLLEIKRIVDEKTLQDNADEVSFWLTGSQRFKMMKDISESLAGRVAVFDLSGFSLAELEGRSMSLFNPEISELKKRLPSANKKTMQEIFEIIFRGFMPKLNTTELDKERFYADYVSTYLERDIRDLAQVGKLNEFYDFLTFMAARTGQEFSYTEIAKNIGVSVPTAKSWVAILERSGIIFILHPYYKNITKRLVKRPKMYFLDTGLASYLCRWPNSETLANGAMSGAFFESFVIAEIVKSYYNSGTALDLYYYRDIDKKEIDLLIVKGNSVYPIEIKKSMNPSNPGKNFAVLNKLNVEVKTGLVLCLNNELIPIDRNSYMYPVWGI